MADHHTIEVRFGDENLTPDKIRSYDIATMISAIERMIAAIVARDNPALNIAENEVTVGLSAIKDGSYVMQFKSQYDREVKRAYAKATHAIGEGNFDNIPLSSIEAVKRVISVSRAYRTETQFGYYNGGFEHVATISPNTPVQIEIPEMEGTTTLYGMLTAIGGMNPPIARLILLNGTRLACNVTERDNLALARELGKRLYTEIGVKGAARWDLRDMSITFFRIDELLEYRKISLTEAVGNLYGVVGEHFEAIDDVDAFFADLRDGNGAS